jgi:diguanylate cyclase (GGDEF)-like protein/PAS domain S-box-containing protein
MTQYPPIYRQIVETADFGIGVINSEGRYIFANPKWAEMTGYPIQEILTLSVFDITFPDHMEASRNSIRDLFSGELSTYTLEKKFRRKDGSEFWGRLVATPIRNDQGEVLAINGLIADITQLRDALARLEQFSSIHEVHSRINALLLDIPSLSDFIPGFTTALTENTPFLKAEVYQLDKNRQSLHPVPFSTRPVDDSLGSLFKQALVSDRPMVGRLSDEPLKGKRFVGIYPVKKGKRPWGLLALTSNSNNIFGPELDPLIKGFAETLTNTLNAHSLAVIHRKTEDQLSRIRHTYRSLLQISAAGSDPSGDREYIARVARILGQCQGMALVTSFLLSTSGNSIEPVLFLAAGVLELAFNMEDPPCFDAPTVEGQFPDLLPFYLDHLGWTEWKNEMALSGSLVSRYITLYRAGKVCGYLSISSFDVNFFDKDILALIEETSRIVSSGLEAWDRDRERKDLEKRQGRLTLVHQALHNLNQLVVKRLCDEDLLKEASRILFEVGRTMEAGFYAPDPGGDRLHLIHYRGQTQSKGLLAYPYSFSADPRDPDSETLTGQAFHTGMAVYANDLVESYRSRGLDSLAFQYRELSWKSAGAIPIPRGNSIYAILVIVSGELDFFDKDMILLLEEFGRTISYAFNAVDLEENRLSAEKKLRNLAALHEALHRISRLLGIRPDPEHLFDETCRILVSCGGLLDATVLLHDAERLALVPKAFYGKGVQVGHIPHRMFLSTEPGHPDGQTGMVTAFRTGTPIVNQDFSENFRKPEFERFKKWGEEFGWKSGASFPIFSNTLPEDAISPICSGRSVLGLLTVTSNETGFFQDSLVSLLDETARSISFALETHKEDLARRESEEKLRKTSELYAALNGINRLVNLRPDEQTLFEETCRIVSDMGMLYLTRILEVDPDNEELRPIAVHAQDGIMVSFFRELSYASPADSDGKFQNLSPQSCIRKKRPVIHHNLVKELDAMGLGVLSAKAMEFRLWSQGSFPISRQGQVAFVLSIFAEKVGFFDEDLVSLLDEISQTLSYALDNIDSDRQRKSAEEHLRSSEEKYRLLMEEAGDGILILDAETTHIIDANKSAARIFGVRKSDLIGQGRSDLLPDASRYLSPNRSPRESSLGDSNSHTIPSRYHLHSNPQSLREVEAIESRLNWKTRSLVQIRIRDVTELHFYETELQKLAQQDSLTGLLNRHSFQIQMDDLLRSASRETHFALFYIDLDNFKSINDTLGHDMGDLVLIDVAGKIRHSVREGDLVARIGGDEFLALVSDALSSQRVSEIAERIIAALDRPSVLNGQSIAIQASIGISLYPEHGTDPKNLIKIADLAMYRSKRLGRNRFFFHGAPESSKLPGQEGP